MLPSPIHRTRIQKCRIRLVVGDVHEVALRTCIDSHHLICAILVHLKLPVGLPHVVALDVKLAECSVAGISGISDGLLNVLLHRVAIDLMNAPVVLALFCPNGCHVGIVLLLGGVHVVGKALFDGLTVILVHIGPNVEHIDVAQTNQIVFAHRTRLGGKADYCRKDEWN